MTTSTMKQRFFALAAALNESLQADEVLLCSFRAEDSDFVRLNHNRIRQAGAVRQYEFSLQLIRGQRHCSATTNISGDISTDQQRIKPLLLRLRTQLAVLADDPFLYYNQVPSNTDDIADNQLPESVLAVSQLIEVAGQMDLVGLYAGGTLYRGFANSLGQQNWHVRHQFNLDWSCYLNTDKAVKANYAGQQWDQAELEQRFNKIEQELSLIAKPAVTLKPGGYRTYLSPSALSEIMGIACWGGFGLKSHHNKSSPLMKLNDGLASFDERIQISEANRTGFAPSFTAQGFIKPDAVNLVDKGKRVDYLVSPRSAKEFEQTLNTNSEAPESLYLSGGKLDANEVLAALDDGLYINNLWYTNFSDRNDCKITGMTRFACFQVKNGQVNAPIKVMRFDQSLFAMLGEKLVDLTSEPECLASNETYHCRSTDSMHLPGVLIDGFELTF